MINSYYLLKPTPLRTTSKWEHEYCIAHVDHQYPNQDAGDFTIYYYDAANKTWYLRSDTGVFINHIYLAEFGVPLMYKDGDSGNDYWKYILHIFEKCLHDR